eukprot:s132_g37.t1
MVSAGRCHTLLLESDGSAVVCGTNLFGECSIPALEEGLSYTQASAGRGHTALLRSDGHVVVCGSNSHGQCNVPALKEGISYTQVSAGEFHTVFLRSDGSAVACGDNNFCQCDIPPLKDRSSYVQVSAGPDYTMFLSSDGQVSRAGGFLPWIPFALQKEPYYSLTGRSCKQVSAGGHHMVVLCHDGMARAFLEFGYDDYGQCQIPDLEDGVSYTQVSAGGLHTLLLRSDGRVVACGSNRFGQCQVPPLDTGSGLTYSEVSAGDYHSVLVRSDGLVVACGDNTYGQCTISLPQPGKTYVCDPRFSSRDIIVQVQEVFEEEFGVILRCTRGLAGKEVFQMKVQRRESAMDLQKTIANALKLNLHHLQVVLPDGKLLSAFGADKSASVEEVLYI